MAILKSLLGDKYKDGMTIEELMELEVDEPKADTTAYDKLKKRFDEVSSEVSQYKKQLRANMTEAELKAAAEAEKYANLEKEVKQLREAKVNAENAKRLVAIGYDEKLATDVAAALFKGDFETVINAQAKFVDAQKKAALAEAVKNTPTPPTGNGDEKTVTKEQFEKMGYSERLNLFNENQELYNELNGGN